MGSISKRKTLELHYTYTGGLGVIVCDGTTRSNRYQPFSGEDMRERESREPATPEGCTPLALRWDNLLDSLRSAVLVGSDESLGCMLVKAEYMLPDGLGSYFPTEQIVGLVTKEMCVDEARLVILRERFEGKTSHFPHLVVTLTYQNIKRDPDFGPDEFTVPAPLPPLPPQPPGK
jgi:hypothetical protein